MSRPLFPKAAPKPLVKGKAPAMPEKPAKMAKGKGKGGKAC